MNPIPLTELAKQYPLSGPNEGQISGISYDSRKVKPGDLFVALVGEKTDGHEYLDQAFQQGATAALVQKKVPSDHALLHSPDTKLALAEVSARFYDHPSRAMQLVGVTGTNGKTTTTHMVEAIFRAHGQRAGVIGTLGSHFEGQEVKTGHTTPQALELQEIFHQMREAKIQGVAMEVSSHALDQDRVAWADFNVAVWTNLTRDHLDYHKTMEAYALAKAKLFKGLAGSSPACGVINRDDPAWETFRDLAPRTLTYGLTPEADLSAEGVTLLPDGSQWTLLTPSGRIAIRLRLPGQFNVYNALAAAGAAYALGIPLPTIEKGLTSLGGVAGRVEVVTPPGHPFTVLVDYAHTPDGLENVLRTARGFTRNRLIAVFGCGGDRDRTKRPIMGRIGTQLSDLAILTSDNPRTEDPAFILSEVAAGAEGSFQTIVDRAEAIRTAIHEAQEGDVVVIAGKGHEDYQIFKDKTIHFDDREEARKAL